MVIIEAGKKGGTRKGQRVISGYKIREAQEVPMWCCTTETFLSLSSRFLSSPITGSWLDLQSSF